MVVALMALPASKLDTCMMYAIMQVVVTDATVSAIAAAKATDRCCWRVSSTVFSHVASDQVLQPLGHFAAAAAAEQYPPTPAGLQVQRELEAIRLKRS